MNAGRVFIVGLCIGFVAALAPACQGTRETCGPDTCASGCCEEGRCLSGTRESACGRGGAACSACGEELACKAGQCEGVDLDAGVVARAANRYTTEQGEVERAVNFSQVAVAALLPEAEGYRVSPGSGSADGMLVVPEVPQARYLLQQGTSYFSTTQRRLDLGSYRLGRPDAIPPATATPLVFQVEGLAEWVPEDELQLFSANGGFLAPSLESSLPAPLSSGATRLEGEIDVRGLAGYRLVEAGRGDSVWLTQLESSGAGGGSRGLTRALRLDSLAQEEGERSTFAGALQAVSLLPAETLTLRLPAFQALRAATHPQATFLAHRLLTSAHPVGLAHGQGTKGADLAISAPASSASDVTVTLSYGNPFPASWGVIRSMTTYFEVKYALPGAAPLSRFPIISHADAPEAFLASAVQPRLTPARALTLGGAPASVDVSGVGLTPEVSWQAPATGTPTTYELLVYRLSVDGGNTVDRFVAGFSVPAPPLRLPAGVLASGERYWLRLRAVARPEGEAERAPLTSTLPESIAETFSGLVSP